MPDNPAPVFARDYLDSASTVALAYLAKTGAIQVGQTGAALEQSVVNALQRNADLLASYGNALTTERIHSFASRYEVVAVVSAPNRSSGIAQGLPAPGADIVALKNTDTGTIEFAVAGVNTPLLPLQNSELLQTGAASYLQGFNGDNYAPVRDVFLSLAVLYPNSNFDFIGHSLGGQMVQVLTADAYLRGMLDRVVTTTTFASEGVSFSPVLPIISGVDNAGQIIRELNPRTSTLKDRFSFIHIYNDSDPLLRTNAVFGLGLGAGFKVILDDQYDLRLTGKPQDLATLADPHLISNYFDPLANQNNNATPLFSTHKNRSDILANVEQAFKEIGKSLTGEEEIVVTASRGTTSIVARARGETALRQTDALTGALLPRNLRRVGDQATLLDNYERTVTYETGEVGGRTVITRTVTSDGVQGRDDTSKLKLDAIAIPVAAIVGVSGCLAVRSRRDDRQDAMHQEVLPEGVAIIAFVGQERLGRCHGDHHQRVGRDIVRGFAACQDEAERASLIV